MLFRFRLASTTVLSCLALFALGCVLPAVAQTNTGPHYGILIVGDQANAEMLRKEKILIQRMAATLRKQAPSQRLPIFSYHINKPRERAYCKARLNVLKEDLLFVGVVTLSGRVPTKVDYRIDRINDPKRAADQVLAEGDDLAGVHVASQQIASPSPSTSPSPPQTATGTPAPARSTSALASASASPSASPTPPGASVVKPGWRVQLGCFTQVRYARDRASQLKHKGYHPTIIRTVTDGTPLFKVTIGPYADRAAADAMVKQLKSKGINSAFSVNVTASSTKNS